MNRFRLPLIALALAALSGSVVTRADTGFLHAAPATAVAPEVAAKGVISRVFGDAAAARFAFESLPPKAGEPDVFEYEASGGKVTVRGTSPTALTRGAYDYIKDHGLGMAVRSGARIALDKPWPDAPKTRVGTPFAFRHHYNAVTFGYQTPYYGRAEWSRELDWLAIHGYDMPMVAVATEAIAARVWKRIGLTQAEIDDFVVGPAHAPWLRMGNIRQVDAPLPQDWHRDQIALQHFILTRMGELGMTPVVQSFAGFVPDAVTRVEPGVTLHDTNWNGGFKKDRRPRGIMPDTTLFAKITKLYMEEYMKEFGPMKYWLVDSFNEMDLPKTGKSKEDMLAGYGADTIRAIRAAKPDAVWAIQGWMFGYQSHIWTPAAVKALLSRVPDDAMLVLDYANDYATNWPKFDGFYGKPWVYGFVPNMGNKTAYTGKLDDYATLAGSMLKSDKRGRIAGFTASGEGMDNNEVVYELLSDVPWSPGASADLDPWLRKYCENKYGACPPAMTLAWKLLRQSAYSGLTPHPTYGWQHLAFGGGNTNRNAKFDDAARSFLSCYDELKGSALYRNDAVEIAALMLSGKADLRFGIARKALDAGDITAADAAFASGCRLLEETDRLLASHPIDRLDRWIAEARAHGDTAALKHYYEANAKRIITIWGPPVNDYAARVWSGLIRDFYLPRMKAAYAGMRSGDGFSRGPWEEKWVASEGVSGVEPYSDPVAEAGRLVDRAMHEKLPVVAEPVLTPLGDWSPAVLDTRWKDLDITLPRDKTASLKGVVFVYKSGAAAIEIAKVALIADGKEVSSDTHAGLAGIPSAKNTYRLKLPPGATINNECLIRATIRGKDNGTDSRGEIRLIE